MYSDFNIAEFTQQLQNCCSRAQTKKFEKNEIITTYIKNRNQICILKNGSADLVRYDVNGNKTIVETLKENDVFGEIFFPVKTNNELFVVAKEEVEIVYFIYDEISYKCTRTCKFHETLNSSLLKLVLNKTISQNIRIELLTKRSIREKLQSYFSTLNVSGMNRTFKIPLSYTDLADYLSVDRSAMMRELKSLQEEGFIERNGSKITLRY
ncbi:MAG: Crp/Fnr family transcriptional regulator [Clostridia bacterium]|nr:Crp/Fnr family transcriptional regulator [Clostridia bacterium]